MANEFESLGFVPEEEFKKLGFEEETPMSEDILDKVVGWAKSAGQTVKENVIDPMADIGQGMVEAIPFAEQMQGGGQALLDVLTGDRGITELPEAYLERTKQFEDIGKASAERSPISHAIGKGVGDVGLMVGTGLAVPAVKSAQSAGKTAKALEYLKEAGIGAGIGGTLAASESPSSILTDPKELGKDVVSGSTIVIS